MPGWLSREGVAMAHNPSDPPDPSSNPDDPRRTNNDTPGGTRDGRGRFKPGHCPNPKGRPRKAKARVKDPLAMILEKKLIDYTSVQANNMPVGEALFRSIISTGMKNAGVAIALLKLVEIAKSSNDPASTSDALAEKEEAVLSHFLEREMRRRRGDSGPGDPDEDEKADT